MTKAKTTKSAPRKRRIRAFKDGAASDAIGTLEPGCELYILTFGQFSLIDAISALLKQTGPAEVTLSTWSAAEADLERSAALLERADITNLRIIVDRSFLSRHPAFCRRMIAMFGQSAIRATRTHAKWVVIRNAEWSLAIRTSMNLNENPRLENLEISDDPALAQFLLDAADDMFRELPPSLFDSSTVAPPLDWESPRRAVAAGSIDRSRLRPPSIYRAP